MESSVNNGLHLLCKAIDIEEDPFMGWKNIILVVLSCYSTNESGLTLEEIMYIIKVFYPKWYSCGPRGGKTVKKTLSCTCSIALREQLIKIHRVDEIKGRCFKLNKNMK